MFDVGGKLLWLFQRDLTQLNPVAIFKTFDFQRFLPDNYAFEYSYCYFSC